MSRYRGPKPGTPTIRYLPLSNHSFSRRRALRQWHEYTSHMVGSSCFFQCHRLPWSLTKLIDSAPPRCALRSPVFTRIPAWQGEKIGAQQGEQVVIQFSSASATTSQCPRAGSSKSPPPDGNPSFPLRCSSNSFVPGALQIQGAEGDSPPRSGNRCLAGRDGGWTVPAANDKFCFHVTCF